ncbi:HNH endonuclease signature motif containing protein [Allobranchiibius sp. CTAmp26]|uniref:HNH endonuclease signature motif containing protein n=1 Tax=Allobranchiibius sp. CTAmp26 TaxID=2815214 RepID=UPI001AA17D52|nr:HNH endonuclease signature motif containing protein [Allobranchiibius sp. CTAmp26]MBO1754810.1 HNH endonuclease [Allobranchiibius sp. CTAmp26]
MPSPAADIDVTEALQQCRSLLAAAYSQAKKDRHRLGLSELESQAAECAAIVNAATAVQTIRVAQYAATERASDADGTDVEIDRGIGHVEEFADTDLAPAMCWSERQATARIAEAVDAVTIAPALLDLMGAGVIDSWRLRRITEVLAYAPHDIAGDVVDTLIARGVTGWTPTQVSRRTRTLLTRLDPIAAETQHSAAARDAVGVFVSPSAHSGYTDWRATLPTDRSSAAYAALDALARELHAETTTGKTLAQCRADALTDLILANAHIETTVVFHVPVDRASKTQSQSAIGDVAVAGVGSISGDTIRRLTAQLGTRVARVLTDPTAGTHLDTTTRAYSPTIAIRRFVETRDEHCRFPGCTAPPKDCDADHVIPWPRGETTPANLQLLCRHHHRAKHETGWRVRMSDNGECTWTSPTGRIYETRPEAMIAARASRMIA